MPDADIQFVRRAYQAAHERGLEALAEFFAEDAVLHMPRGPLHGSTAVVELLHRLEELAAPRELELALEAVSEANGWVIVRSVWQTHRHGAAQPHYWHSAAVRVRGGEIVEARVFIRHSDALRATRL